MNVIFDLFLALSRRKAVCWGNDVNFGSLAFRKTIKHTENVLAFHQQHADFSCNLENGFTLIGQRLKGIQRKLWKCSQYPAIHDTSRSGVCHDLTVMHDLIWFSSVCCCCLISSVVLIQLDYEHQIVHEDSTYTNVSNFCSLTTRKRKISIRQKLKPYEFWYP